MENKERHFVYNKSNYTFLFVGIGLNVLGYILMIGGAAENLDEFNAEELFSHRRITLAPILIVLGYIAIIYSIMKKPKKNN